MIKLLKYKEHAKYFDQDFDVELKYLEILDHCKKIRAKVFLLINYHFLFYPKNL